MFHRQWHSKGPDGPGMQSGGGSKVEKIAVIMPKIGVKTEKWGENGKNGGFKCKNGEFLFVFC